MRVGLFTPFGLLDRGPRRLSAYLVDLAATGIDQVCCADHVSFRGTGFDGLVQASALLTAHPTLPVYLGLYQLPMRHPVLVARQLADLARLAPGRLVFGVGIGGEDRHEVQICGVDPATRGARMDESLQVLRRLLTGEPVTFHGNHFELVDAVIGPPPAPPVPLVVGGRSDAAVRRAGRLGDGWIGIWNSPRRFAEAAALAAAEGAALGRTEPATRHAMQVWCAVGTTREQARNRLADRMQEFYQLPFERFERYCPYGTAQDVAQALVPYLAAGCSEFNLLMQGADDDSVIEAAATVRSLLVAEARARAGTGAGVAGPVAGPATPP